MNQQKQKKKILVIADSPLVPSGVGTQTKYFIESLLETGEYSFVCLAGAIRHEDYRIQRVENWGDDWLIHPVDGYGNPDIVRTMLNTYKPDALWFMTDPRFYVWLWDMEDEIRDKVPMIYYHVWDNYPYPTFNKQYYDSNDLVCTISKVTDDIVRNVSPDVDCVRIPHTVDTKTFCKKTADEDLEIRKALNAEGKMLLFWNNRNARRKQSGTLIFWFQEFLEKVGRDKAVLVMHTEPKDPNGQDLIAIMNSLGLENGEVRLSTQKLNPSDLAKVYSASDCTINISDAEGFGLATLESLACETPIIVTMTGGMQEQVTDGEKWFGFGIEPSSKAIIGSQDVPWIYEDRIAKDDFMHALTSLYEMTTEERSEMGKMGRTHVLDNYGHDMFKDLWQNTFKEAMQKYGSWENRKNYKKWELVKLK
jgi:glycosyltransferase involved in cell wall biosynthesis